MRRSLRLEAVVEAEELLEAKVAQLAVAQAVADSKQRPGREATGGLLDRALADIEHVFHELGIHGEAHAFGSTVTGFQTGLSDLDVPPPRRESCWTASVLERRCVSPGSGHRCLKDPTLAACECCFFWVVHL